MVAAADAYYQNWQIWLAEAHGSHAVRSLGTPTLTLTPTLVLVLTSTPTLASTPTLTLALTLTLTPTPTLTRLLHRASRRVDG